jgi:hypothetical protein
MCSRALRNWPGWNSLPGPSQRTRRLFHHSPPLANAAAAASVASPVASGSNTDMNDYRLMDLIHNLQLSEFFPNRVWAHYKALLYDVEPNALPIDLHRRVLRKCTPSFGELRTTSTQAKLNHAPLTSSHVHEIRFRAVLGNILSSGGAVQLDDFHFILEQYAAVGHHAGAVQLLDDMVKHYATPTSKTYALVLQALAHRLTLPIREDKVEDLKAQASKSCMRVLKALVADELPMTPACIDLSLRILRETTDAAGLDLLVKSAYGIDLSPPADASFTLGSMFPKAPAASSSEIASHKAAETMPISLAALNTILNALGQSGRISKMVHVFEVLTNPLPPPPTEEDILDVDDEEDDIEFGQAWTQSEPSVSVSPNTTSYNLLIQWAAEAKNATLARHYVTCAMQAEHVEDRRLRGDIYRNVPLADLVAPSVAVTRRTIMPVVGLANRTHDIFLLRWLRRICNRVIRRKTVHIGHYQQWVAQLHAQGLHDPLPIVLTDIHGARRYIAEYKAADRTADATPTMQPAQNSKPLQVDLDAASPDHVEPVKKRLFRPAVHIAILQRDLYDIVALADRIQDSIIGKKLQREKERLGRRVWQDKDVFLRDKHARVVVSREDWQQMVGFKPKEYTTLEPWRDVWSAQLVRERQLERQRLMRQPRAERESSPSPEPVPVSSSSQS